MTERREMTPEERAETLKAWLHWAKTNPVDDDQLQLAISIEEAIAAEREAALAIVRAHAHGLMQLGHDAASLWDVEQEIRVRGEKK